MFRNILSKQYQHYWLRLKMTKIMSQLRFQKPQLNVLRNMYSKILKKDSVNYYQIKVSLKHLKL